MIVFPRNPDLGKARTDAGGPIKDDDETRMM